MTTESTSPDNPDDAAWQRRLLPFMVTSIAAMAAFFLIVSVVLLYSLYSEVRLRAEPPTMVTVDSHDAAAFEIARWQTLVRLEERVIGHRYQQVNATLLLRAWTRYLGFLTGMILAMVGAVFVLGKMREAGTSINVEGAGWRGAVTSSSPGLILATLGTLLMAVTLVIPYQFDVRDVPVYLQPNAASSSAPLPLSTQAQLHAEDRALFPGPQCATNVPSQAEANNAH